jgi:hypothetical protein
MNKKIVEFSQTEHKGKYEINVAANAMTPDEFQRAITELDSLYFRYQHIDADSIWAKFKGIYDAAIAMDVLQKLEEKGWTWE